MDIEEENDIFDEYHQKHQQQQSMIIGTSSSLSPMVVETSSSSSSFNNNSITGLLWNSSNNLAQMYRMRPKLCDVCLVTDDGCHIYAHRAILSSSMHYFSTMFIGQDFSTESTNCIIDDHVDSRINNISSSSSSTTASASTSYNVNFIEQNQYQISIKNLDGNSLNEIIKYCYLGIVNINETNVQMLLSAATMLNCKDIIKICCEFLRSKLQTSNAIGIYSFAEIMGCKDLKDFTFAFILQNFVQIFQNDEFIQLSTERVVEIISSDYLDTGDEGEHIVLAAVINWIMFDYNERRQYLSQLIEHIRFPRFNQEELINIENEYPLVKNEPASKDLLIEALKYHLMKNSCFRERISRTRQQCLIVIGGQAPKAICQCEYFDFSTNKWNEFICELPSRRCRSGIVVHHGLIYAIGGFNGQCRIRSVDMFDPKSNKWTQCASLEVKRSTLGACVLNGLIYAVGGFDGTLGLQSAEVYNPITRSWRFIEPMTTRRSSVAVVTLNGLLYAVGGYDGSSRQCLSSVECYNPEIDHWKRIPDMSQRRSGAGVEVLYEKIYAIGGHDGPAIRKSVECYDPTTNQWSQCADMIYARRNAVVVSNDGLLYVVGGEDGQTNLKSVEVYDPKSNSWSLLSSEMSIGRSYAGVAVIEKTWP
ncbi:kelch-like protein 28 [Dermatophagoides farinae]|uniref:kelch-like protein 28 n=1 Tax=Dermatophagoides farinae TaxID=6954 RepID=UPI003F603714